MLGVLKILDPIDFIDSCKQNPTNIFFWGLQKKARQV